MHHLGPIWYHSEPSDVPYSQNLPRPISWFGLFLQQNDSSTIQQGLMVSVVYQWPLMRNWSSSTAPIKHFIFILYKPLQSEFADKG